MGEWVHDKVLNRLVEVFPTPEPAEEDGVEVEPVEDDSNVEPEAL